VGTASTKSRNRNQRVAPQSASKKRTEDHGPAESPRVEVSELTWLVAVGAILLIAAVLRFYNLDLVPLHHDEGVNGNFLVRLVRDGYYHYDPANYHGPTLYYLSALFPWVLRVLFGVHAQNTYGLTTTAIRFVPALFGLGTIGLIFSLRRNLGTLATLAAAGLLAVSPGAVYLSRYFIHETLFVFFTLAIVVTALKYFESGRPKFLILAAAAAAMLFATKETAIISAVVLVLALLLTRVFYLIWDGGPGNFAGFMERVGGPTNLTVWILAAIAVFVLVNVLFYSSFFSNYPKGVWDSLETFKFWSKTGKEAHVHPLITYVWWLFLQESPLLILGAVGAILAILKPVKSFALFAVLWAFGLIAAYSLIAYKTPWLCLNFIVPLALISGHAVEQLFVELAEWELSTRVRAAVVAGVLLLALGPLAGFARAFDKAVSNNLQTGLFPALMANTPHRKTFIPGYQTIDLNFYNYDNDDSYYVYVYAHTRRDLLKLVDEINRIAERTHQGGQTGITIVSPDYWPLPWYLRDYSRVGYHGRMVVSNEPIILASLGQMEEVETNFGDRYQKVNSGLNPAGSYALRPGVDLLLYTRRELMPPP
jgi:uncharacterized protein (TIGR03663 family)